MVKGGRKLVIDNTARAALRQTYESIKKDSPQNAEKVRDKILESFKNLLISRFCIHRTNTGFPTRFLRIKLILSG